MAIDPSLPESCAPIARPEPNFDGAAWISSWVVDCPTGIAGETVTIDGLAAQRTDVLLRIEPLERSPLTIRLTPENPTHVIVEDASKLAVFGSYASLGFDHILEGWDHLLFVFALVLLIHDVRRLIAAITAFTVAHSVTLALASLGYINVPGPPVEAVIALSIVFMAAEILKCDRRRLAVRAPWLISFSFGLLHGLGFAGALSDIGLPDQDIVIALLAFNVGVEAGQLAFVSVILLLMAIGRRLVASVPGQGATVTGLAHQTVSYAVGGIATFWVVERVMAF
ncbi:HupE/UreJ family protein [Shimia sp. R10_1]|uniref:HupE/UreJ family protein n=1 Tax=Shimia sp. R10_1 TaxID=2821095 RepID=UPI001FFDFEF5|nr:HupE/UreJ family protein [Shimia sp. R10_1]